MITNATYRKIMEATTLGRRTALSPPPSPPPHDRKTVCHLLLHLHLYTTKAGVVLNRGPWSGEQWTPSPYQPWVPASPRRNSTHPCVHPPASSSVLPEMWSCSSDAAGGRRAPPAITWSVRAQNNGKTQSFETYKIKLESRRPAG